MLLIFWVCSLRREHSALLDRAVHAYDHGEVIGAGLKEYRKKQRVKMDQVQVSRFRLTVQKTSGTELSLLGTHEGALAPSFVVDSGVVAGVPRSSESRSGLAHRIYLRFSRFVLVFIGYGWQVHLALAQFNTFLCERQL